MKMSVEHYVEVGKLIRRLRENSGLSQKQLSAKIDVPQSRVSYWERGAYLPGLLEAFRLADTLGVDINTFRLEKTSCTRSDQPKKSLEEKIHLLEQRMRCLEEQIVTTGSVSSLEEKSR